MFLLSSTTTAAAAVLAVSRNSGWSNNNSRNVDASGGGSRHRGGVGLGLDAHGEHGELALLEHGGAAVNVAVGGSEEGGIAHLLVCAAGHIAVGHGDLDRVWNDAVDEISM